MTLSLITTATSVTLSWTQDTNSLPAESYTVSLIRMAGDDNGMCALPSDARFMMNILPSTTSMEFTEFSFTVALGDTSDPLSTVFTAPSIGNW